MKRFVPPALLLLTFSFCMMTQIAVSQDSTAVRKVGISASLQDNQIDVLVPIWMGSQFSLSPVFGMIWTGGTGADLHIGIVPRFFLSTEKVAPYLGARLAVLQTLPAAGSGTTDWLVGGAFGGEYFVDRHFSIGIESQLNLTISDVNSSRFGNPGKEESQYGSRNICNGLFLTNNFLIGCNARSRTKAGRQRCTSIHVNYTTTLSTMTNSFLKRLRDSIHLRVFTPEILFLLILPTVKLLVHLLAVNGYGVHGDELYYLACSDHLDWGYVDQPPLSIFLLHCERVLFGDSMLSIRLFPALAGFFTVLFTGLLARRMGARLPAQLLAESCALVAPCVPGCASLLFYERLRHSLLARRDLSHRLHRR